MGLTGIMDSHSPSNSSTLNACQRCGCPCSVCGKVSKEFDKDSELANQKPSFSTTSSPPAKTTTHYHHHHHLVTTTANLDLQHQIEVLNARLKQNNEHVQKLEHALIESRQRGQNEAKKLQTELRSHRDKYDRLLESHRQMQRVNQMLEEKILSKADEVDGKNSCLQALVRSLDAELKSTTIRVRQLEDANARLRHDCSLATRLLHVRSSSFLPRRIDDLPAELRDRVSARLTYDEMKALDESRKSEGGPRGGFLSYFTISPSNFISTFPPSAMTFSNETSTTSSTGQLSPSESGDGPPVDDFADELPTSVLTRVFEAALDDATHPGASSVGSSASVTEDQDRLLMHYTSEARRPAEVLRYYMCRRCRIQCVTTDNWTQTSIGPIYGGDGCRDGVLGTRNAAGPTTISHSLHQAASSSSRVRTPKASEADKSLRHASTYPDLVASAEIATRSGYSSRPSPQSSVANDSSFLLDSAQYDRRSCDRRETKESSSRNYQIAVNDSHAVWMEEPRKRHDSETGSLSGGGWGDIHIFDGLNVSLSGAAHSEMGIVEVPNLTDSRSVALVVPELAPCMEEVALDDTS